MVYERSVLRTVFVLEFLFLLYIFYLVRFEMAHHTLGLSHQTIVQHPYILLKNRLVLRDRHLFLKKLGRDQYDPAKPNFVSPKTLCEDSDSEFCTRSAKIPVEYYNKFLLST